MNKDITLATCCLLLLSTQALADRPATSERTEIFEPEAGDISTSTDHRPAAEAVNEAATTEDNTKVKAAPEKEPVIRVYNHTTDTEVTGNIIELQPDGTLPVRVLDFPRRGLSMEKV
ncbi:MAG: hypothetical protein PF589_07885 [Gammaproteobacteria bacterium]|jgi:hypothetical protein|nr:hypothetical protein [Gammaproteobacteria bacterium]